VKRQDRLRLQCLSNLVSAIPFPQPGGGSQSASVAGFVSYADDMRQAMSVHRDVLRALILAGLPNHHEGEDYRDPDVLLDSFEAWIKAREAARWSYPSVPIMRNE
jgi:hypothetical protein